MSARASGLRDEVVCVASGAEEEEDEDEDEDEEEVLCRRARRLLLS